jgi:hypothetical protein
MKRMVKASEACRRLTTIPGVGHSPNSPSQQRLTIPSASVEIAANQRLHWHIRRRPRTLAHMVGSLCAEGANVRFPADPTIRWQRPKVRSGSTSAEVSPATKQRLRVGKWTFPTRLADGASAPHATLVRPRCSHGLGRVFVGNAAKIGLTRFIAAVDALAICLSRWVNLDQIAMLPPAGVGEGMHAAKDKIQAGCVGLLRG